MKTIDSNEERIKQLEENIEMRQKMYDREIQKEKSVIPTSLAGGLFGFIFVKMFTETFVWWLSGLGAIVAFSWVYKVSSEANTRARNLHLSDIDYLRDKINAIKNIPDKRTSTDDTGQVHFSLVQSTPWITSSALSNNAVNNFFALIE